MRERFPSAVVLAFMAAAAWSVIFAVERTAPAIDATVTCVASGGYWETSQVHGHYRIVVDDRGWEHVASAVWIEWIEERKEGDRVHQRVPVSEINTHAGLSVGCPKLSYNKEDAEFRFDAVESHEPSRRHVMRILPGAPGAYQWKASPK